MQHAQPSIGGLYSTRSGEEVEVIGLGTGGIVVEYADGRVELLDAMAWQQLNPRAMRTSSQQAFAG
ncbi:MAG: hypothetical protein PVF75_03890 [Granulosicoccaceae bacterium]|jgi:hypothetical protein